MTDIYGPFVSRGVIQAAALSLLSARITEYIAEVERQFGLAARTIPLPPGPSSYRRGVSDTDLFQAEWLPAIFVECQPLNPPERAGAGDYGQWFELRCSAIFADDDENVAAQRADQYGMAIYAAIAQHGSLGGKVSKTVATGAPDIEYLDPKIRQVVKSVCVFRSWVDVSVTEQGGLATVPSNPYSTPADWPTVEVTNVQLSTLPLT